MKVYTWDKKELSLFLKEMNDKPDVVYKIEYWIWNPVNIAYAYIDDINYIKVKGNYIYCSNFDMENFAIVFIYVVKNITARSGVTNKLYGYIV